MDLLDNILNSMDKCAPPQIDEKQKLMIKKQKQFVEQQQNHEKNELNRFRKYVEERITRFLKDERHFIQFPPADRVHRSIVHEVCIGGATGLVAMSFGQENVDRYIVVYKKEFSPTENEVLARKNNEEWNEETAEKYAKDKQIRIEIEKERLEKPHKVVPLTNYKDKYKHLIGEDAALEAAKKTETNQSYGIVPSANKRDLRSIEKVQADIQAKKKLKIQEEPIQKVDEVVNLLQQDAI